MNSLIKTRFLVVFLLLVAVACSNNNGGPRDNHDRKDTNINIDLIPQDTSTEVLADNQTNDSGEIKEGIEEDNKQEVDQDVINDDMYTVHDQINDTPTTEIDVDLQDVNQDLQEVTNPDTDSITPDNDQEEFDILETKDAYTDLLDITDDFKDTNITQDTVQDTVKDEGLDEDINQDTNQPFFLKLEAEDARIHGAVVATDHSNYSGTGFVDYQNPSGDYIEWTAHIPLEDKYEISFAYALAIGDRPLEIKVNGHVVASRLHFPATGSFEVWGTTEPLVVQLKAGDNTIRATAIGASGANIDYMTIKSIEPPPEPSATCQLYGLYELTFKGSSVPNPDDIGLSVIFTLPDGTKRTISGFYVGNNTWKSRMYCDLLGDWTWQAHSTKAGINENGGFTVVRSKLPGKLRRHIKNKSYFMTDNKETFINITDTAYYLFANKSTKWKEYIKDAVEHGVSSFRALIFNPDDWNRVFLNGNRNRFNYVLTKTVSDRLKWMLQNYPRVYVQLIMLPSPPGYRQDDNFWHTLSKTQQQRILNNIIARFAAFPNIFWQIQNDIDYVGKPHNIALANQVGQYLKTHDIFNNLRSTGGIRNQPFQFTKASWPTYIHLETQDTTPEKEISRYASTNLPVFDGEDRYETHHAPLHPRIFFRRHIWSWLLSGGSAAYGGTWAHIRPYNTATFTTSEYPSSGLPAGTYKLKGLDSIPYIPWFFNKNHIDLVDYHPDDNRVLGPTPPRQCQVMVSKDNKHYIIYHPNAAGINRDASLTHAVAKFSIKNLRAGRYKAFWMRADNGKTTISAFTHSGGPKAFTAPWPAVDVVVYIYPN